MITVSSTTDSPQLREKAKQLAARLSVPFLSKATECSSKYILAYSTNGLHLMTKSENGKRLLSVLHVDFTTGKNLYRFQHDRTIKQPLAKAVGIRGTYRPKVFDATPGLGQDGFVLASLGCEVTMCERSVLLYELLLDGLSRASANPVLADSVLGNIRLYQGDSRNFVVECRDIDTVYLDPMYPHTKKTALNSLVMRTIRELVGDDPDSGELLEISRKVALQRVVVKRPRHGSALGQQPCSHTILMKNSRFDVYLSRNR